MKSHHTIIATIAATLLAVGTLSPALAAAAPERGHHKGYSQECGERGKHAHHGAKRFQLEGLSESQQEQINAIVEAGREQSRQRRSEMRDLRRSMAQAQGQEEREALAAQQAELYKAGVLARSERRAQIEALLSDEQREQLQQKRQERQERMASHKRG